MPVTDLLYEAALPIGDGQALNRVLIHLVSRAEQSMRFVVSDLEETSPAYTHSGADVPEHYDARLVGGLEEFLQVHAHHVQALMLVGASEFGPLTLARAAHAMATGPHGAQEALAAAVDQSQRCEAMVQRHQQILDSISQ